MRANQVSKRGGHAWEERNCNCRSTCNISLSALTAKAICQKQQQPELLSHQENKNASALNDQPIFTTTTALLASFSRFLDELFVRCLQFFGAVAYYYFLSIAIHYVNIFKQAKFFLTVALLNIFEKVKLHNRRFYNPPFPSTSFTL